MGFVWKPVAFGGKQCTLNYSVEWRIQGYNKIIGAVPFSVMEERQPLSLEFGAFESRGEERDCNCLYKIQKHSVSERL